MPQVRTISPTEALSTVWEEVVYTEARLLNDPRTRDLAPGFGQLVESVLTAEANQRKVWRDEVVAQASCDTVNVDFDLTVESLGLQLFVVVNRDRKSALWRRYFPKTVHDVTRLALGRQVNQTRGWPSSLETEEDAALQAYAPQIAKLVADGDTALQSRVNAASRRADQRAREITDLVEDINALRTNTLGRLLQRAVKHKLPRDWAESFFRRANRRVEAATETDSDGEDEGGGNAPG